MAALPATTPIMLSSERRLGAGLVSLIFEPPGKSALNKQTVMAHRSVGHPVGLAIVLKVKRRRHLGGPHSRAMTSWIFSIQLNSAPNFGSNAPTPRCSLDAAALTAPPLPACPAGYCRRRR